MAAGSTYTPIATTTLGSSSNTITFNSISSAYTDLILILNPVVNTLSEFDIRVGNGSVDTGSNYSTTTLTGDGSTATSIRTSGQTRMRLNYNSVLPTTLGNANHIIHFMNYANATTYKTVLYRGNDAGYGVDASVGLWRSTSAINIITLYANVAGTKTFSSGTVATLYGIASA